MKEFRIAEVAQERGITNPHQLALKSGQTVNAVRALWENRSERPATKLLRSISRTLQVPIGDLYETDPELTVVQSADTTDEE